MIITVAHQKGGTGKSTLATNISGMLGATMLDLDKQHSSALWNHVRSMDSELESLEINVLKGSGDKLSTTKTLNEEEIKLLCQTYKKNPNKVLVIDTAGFDAGINRLAIVMADMVITPVAPSQIELFGLQTFEQIIKEANNTLKYKIPCYVVLNSVVESSKTHLESVLEWIKGKDTFTLLNTRLGRRVDFQRAYEEGMTVVEYNHCNRAAKEMSALVAEIMVELIHEEEIGA